MTVLQGKKQVWLFYKNFSVALPDQQEPCIALDHNPATISLQVDFLDWNEYHNKPKKLHRPADVDLVVFVMTNLVY